jgi:anti-sigma regulatory factor (Ser/Thr protein kinase)
MSGVAKQRGRTQAIRDFILDELSRSSRSPTTAVREKFDITRQAAHKHLRALIEDGLIDEHGSTRGKTYTLAQIDSKSWAFELKAELEEHVVWRDYVRPALPADLKENVLAMAEYGVTEMVNNAIDHSRGKLLRLLVQRTARVVIFLISDDGIGIFRKLQEELKLGDEREAILELTKGKLTTDQARHSGQGIFFTSRMCDMFTLMSDHTALVTIEGADWALERDDARHKGTIVSMKINLGTERTDKEVFDRFTTDFEFDKTVVPVALAKYGDENLVSRSQAKRLLARVDRFAEVLLDFSGVKSVGQAFADEVFRVFANAHPNVRLIPIGANAEVNRFIKRALATKEQLVTPVDEQLALPLKDPSQKKG